MGRCPPLLRRVRSSFLLVLYDIVSPFRLLRFSSLMLGLECLRLRLLRAVGLSTTEERQQTVASTARERGGQAHVVLPVSAEGVVQPPETCGVAVCESCKEEKSRGLVESHE
jgi:hypothetical protein